MEFRLPYAARGRRRRHRNAAAAFDFYSSETSLLAVSAGSADALSSVFVSASAGADSSFFCVIDTLQLYLKKLQLQASMKSVESQRPDVNKQIAATRQQIATARREKRRVENLLKAGAANQKQLDDWEAQIALLERQLTAQMSSLQNSTNSLTEQGSSVAIQVAQVEDQLAKCHVVSPISGTVLAKYAEAGELAAVGKPLFKVADIDQMYLRAYITSEQLSLVKLGNRVTVFSDYGGEERKEYPGVVTWISDRSEFTPKTILTKEERANLVYAVKIAVKNDGLLKIGMYGGVKL